MNVYSWKASTDTETNLYSLTFKTDKQYVIVHLKNNEVQYTINPEVIVDSQTEICIGDWEGDKGIVVRKKEGVNQVGIQTCFLYMDNRVLDDFKEYIKKEEFGDHSFHVSTNDANNHITNRNSEYAFEESLANAYSQPSSHEENVNPINENVSDPEFVRTSQYRNTRGNTITSDPNLPHGGKRRKQKTQRRRRGGRKI